MGGWGFVAEGGWLEKITKQAEAEVLPSSNLVEVEV